MGNLLFYYFSEIAKAPLTIPPIMAELLHRLDNSISKYQIKKFVVLDPGQDGVSTTALRP